MYLYITLRSDPQYSISEYVELIKIVLEHQKELKPVGDRAYANSSAANRWIKVGIINCDAQGNYPAGLAQDGATANLVEFIFADDGDDQMAEQNIALATKVAAALNWQAVNDSTGEMYYNVPYSRP